MKSKEFLITSSLLVLIIYTVSLSVVSQAFPQNQQTATFSSTGSIQIQTSIGISVYSDFQCEYELNSVSWGTLQPEGTKEIVCFIRNEGNTPVLLSLETTNWQPASAANYLDLSWDYGDVALDPEDIVQITLLLSVSPNIEGITDFGFDITIVGS